MATHHLKEAGISEDHEKLATILSGLMGNQSRISRTNSAMSREQLLQKLAGFGFMIFPVGAKAGTGFLLEKWNADLAPQTEKRPYYGDSLTTPLHQEPFKAILIKTRRTLAAMPAGGRPLSAISRGGFSYRQIEERILPEIAKKLRIPKDDIRLPSHAEAALYRTQEDDSDMEEYYCDQRAVRIAGNARQKIKNKIISLRGQLNPNPISDEACYDNHFLKKEIAQLEKELAGYILVLRLRGNSHAGFSKHSKNTPNENDWYPHEEVIPNSFFRILIELQKSK